MAPTKDDDWSEEFRIQFMKDLCQRPSFLTEVRRDGKDNAAVTKVIKDEFRRRWAEDKRGKKKFVHR